MDVPDPSGLPIGKIRKFLSKLCEVIGANKPVAGEGIQVSEFPGQGTVISLNNGTFQKLDLLVCVGGVQKTVTFYVAGAPH